MTRNRVDIKSPGPAHHCSQCRTSQGVPNEPFSKCPKAASSWSALILKYSLTSSLPSSCDAPEVSSTCGYELRGSDERRTELENPSLLPAVWLLSCRLKCSQKRLPHAPSAGRRCASEQHRLCLRTVRRRTPAERPNGALLSPRIRSSGETRESLDSWVRVSK